MATAVYVFGQMKVKDYDTYLKTYGVPFYEVLQQYNGTLLSATKRGMTLEGKPFGNWTVLARFESAEDAGAFYQSAAYAPLKKLRLEELTEGAQAFSFPAEIPEL